ncbi:hypothetical protein PR048_010985 [Dryococelus australis]|uniref:Uncharacterized protein n=1 Tax=Dryococelus australis TaxID=614101 RepID=A0ABQ9HKD3_9NEOP|nr:hypothetical protein PR048_010985 [Dryococelus australis]
MKTILREGSLGNVSPQQNRGKHDNRPSKIGNHIWEMVTEHWDMFPSKNSHYGRSKSKMNYFDDTTLTVMKMYKKVDYEIHKRKLMKYNSFKKEYIEKVKPTANEEDTDTLVSEFDYIQNLAVPKLNVTSQFYKRLFCVYVFNIHPWLSKLLSVNITHLFPVRGHSHNQNDRNFGLYSQFLKKIECIEHPD